MTCHSYYRDLEILYIQPTQYPSQCWLSAIYKTDLCNISLSYFSFTHFSNLSSSSSTYSQFSLSLDSFLDGKNLNIFSKRTYLFLVALKENQLFDRIHLLYSNLVSYDQTLQLGPGSMLVISVLYHFVHISLPFRLASNFRSSCFSLLSTWITFASFT